MRAATFLQRLFIGWNSGGKASSSRRKKQREATASEIEKIAEGFASAAADAVTSRGALALHRYADRVVDRSNHHAVNVLAVFPALLGDVATYADPGSINVRQGTAEAGSVAAVACYRLRASSIEAEPTSRSRSAV